MISGVDHQAMSIPFLFFCEIIIIIMAVTDNLQDL